MPLASRQIGRSEVRTTVLGFGGAPLGAVGQWLNEADADHMVQAAFEGGIRYFDTAPLYGHGLSEKRLGRNLRRLNRDDIVVSTKVGRLLVPINEGERNTGMRDDEPFSICYDYSYDGARRSLDESLARLGLDHIDIALIHDIDVWTHGESRQQEVFQQAVSGALRALTEYREQGIIGAFGLGVNEWPVCARLLDLAPVDCFLLAGRFTLLEQEPLESFLPKCLEHGASVIVGGPYNSGLLAVTERRRATYDYKPASEELWQRAGHIRSICEQHGVDIRAAALQYPLRHPAIAAVIPGPKSIEEAEQNLAFAQADIPAALWDELDATGFSRHPT